MSLKKILCSVLCVFALTSDLRGWTFFKPTPRTSLHDFKQLAKRIVTVVLNPSGSSHDGREIDGIPEKTITYQCALELKKNLEAQNNYLRVIVLKESQNQEPYEYISAANRAHPDLFINIQAFYATQNPFPFYIYHLMYHQTDSWNSRETKLSFIPIDMTHKISIKNSILMGKALCSQLKLSQTHELTCMGFFGIPCKPLMGIMCPTISVEMGFAHQDDFQKIISPLTQAIDLLINTINYSNHDIPT